MKKLVVKLKKEENSNIGKYICNEFKNLSYSSLCKAFRNKDIKLNGKRINKENINVVTGDEIEVYITDNILYGLPKDITYVYEDENVLIAYKPKGIITAPEESINEITFYEIVKQDIIKKENDCSLRICHRLDRNTDGLVIFTKNDVAYKEMLDTFKNRYLDKIYVAYVNNSYFTDDKSIEEAYLFTDKSKGMSYISSIKKTGYEKIITEYEVLEKNSKLDYAKLKVVLHTGKTHQIRAHLRHMLHPIIGDSKYGINEVNKKFKKSKQCLTAVEYRFKLPVKFKLSYLNSEVVRLEEKMYKF